MEEIKLTQGKVAIIDDEDYAKTDPISWRIFRTPNNKYYARGWTKINGAHKTIWLHRLVLNLGIENPIYVDHINGNGLDNRKQNLRLANYSQNQHNRGAYKNNTSGYKGVVWNKSAQKWHAQIRYNGKRYYLGVFDIKELAALAYNKAALEYHGEFARLNNVKVEKVIDKEAS